MLYYMLKYGFGIKKNCYSHLGDKKPFKRSISAKLVIMTLYCHEVTFYSLLENQMSPEDGL